MKVSIDIAVHPKFFLFNSVFKGFNGSEKINGDVIMTSPDFVMEYSFKDKTLRKDILNTLKQIDFY